MLTQLHDIVRDSNVPDTIKWLSIWGRRNYYRISYNPTLRLAFWQSDGSDRWDLLYASTVYNCQTDLEYGGVRLDTFDPNYLEIIDHTHEYIVGDYNDASYIIGD